MVDDTNKDIVDTTEPGILNAFKDNILLENNPSSLLSLLSSITAKQGKILNYIFTSEMMALEASTTGNGQTPIMDVYNALWLAANLNIFTKEKYNSKLTQYIQNNTKATLGGIDFFQDTSKMPYATKQQLISVVNDNSMKYITKLGDDIKVELSKVLKDGVINGKYADETIRSMQDTLKMNGSRARTIVRTETMRAANSAAYAQAIYEGKGYYIVDSRAEACAICKREYLGRIFTINETKFMPPLHPNCACIPMFFDNSSDAKIWADKIGFDIDQQVAALEKKGLTIKPDGTGAEVNKIPTDKRLKN